MEVSIKGKTSLNSLVVIGSKIQVDGLEETKEYEFVEMQEHLQTFSNVKYMYI